MSNIGYVFVGRGKTGKIMVQEVHRQNYPAPLVLPSVLAIHVYISSLLYNNTLFESQAFYFEPAFFNYHSYMRSNVKLIFQMSATFHKVYVY